MTGRSCPFCRFPLKEGTTIAECTTCHAVHHADCFAENGGCAIAGCPGGPTMLGAATTAADQATAQLPRLAPRPPATKVEFTAPSSAGEPGAQPPSPTSPGRGLAPTIAVAAVAAVLVAGGAIAAIIVSTRGTVSAPAHATTAADATPTSPTASNATSTTASPPSNAATTPAATSSGCSVSSDGCVAASAGDGSPISASGAAQSDSNGPPSDTHQCDPNIFAGLDTTCPFAENVFQAVALGYQRLGTSQIPGYVTAYSAATGKTYQLTCQINDAQQVVCTNSTDSETVFSTQSVYVYHPIG